MSEEQVTVDVTQQATAPAPKTQPAKNPKRVTAGKAAAQKTRRPGKQRKKP